MDSIFNLSNMRTIWVIDDDMVTLFSTSYKIHQYRPNYNVVSFHSIENAIAAYERCLSNNEQVPNVLLLDLQFPTLGGWYFLKKLEEYNISDNEIDIYILSAFSKPESTLRALKHPLVKGYFYKPVTLAELNVL
ncbi:hypothetical protein LCGC14_1257730 [marine sediment metagenome]|uniref:Response regulator n=2 Tax=root TaxID=1 RepID=A0A831QLY3_9FLAO|nr:response regulator [Pricia antarctica]